MVYGKFFWFTMAILFFVLFPFLAIIVLVIMAAVIMGGGA